MFQVPIVLRARIAGNLVTVYSVVRFKLCIFDKLRGKDKFVKASFFRVLNVSLAGHADGNGLYTMSNLTSKRVVYERISGGLRPLEKR
jgi:hypothetical protein